MLTLRDSAIALVFAVLSIGFGLTAFSKENASPIQPREPPAIGSREKGAAQPQHFPVERAVQVAAGSQEDRERKKAEEDASEYWSIFGHRTKITDSLLAAFTFCLVIIGWWQGVQLRRTVASMVVGERPYLYIDAPQARLFPEGAHAIYPTSADVPLPRVGWSVVNRGRTTAVIKRIRLDLQLHPTENPDLAYSADALDQTGDLIVVPDKASSTEPCIYRHYLTPEQIGHIKQGLLFFFFFGEITYTDIFGFIHVYGFCLRLHIHGKALEWTTSGGKTYNYRKSARNPDERVVG